MVLAGLGQGHLTIVGRALLRDGVVRLHALYSIFSSPKWGLSLGKSPDCVPGFTVSPFPYIAQVDWGSSGIPCQGTVWAGSIMPSKDGSGL